MYIIQFPVNKYSKEEVAFIEEQVSEKLHLPKEQLLIIPDNIEIFKDDLNKLFNLRSKISQMIESYRYDRRCQWEETADAVMPCKTKELSCEQCKFFYSNDDKLWLDEY